MITQDLRYGWRLMMRKPAFTLVAVLTMAMTGLSVTSTAAELGVNNGKLVGAGAGSATMEGELIEAYLLDFDGDLYGRPLRLEFLKRLRGEKRFDSVEALVAQMGEDVDEARAIAG